MFENFCSGKALTMAWYYAQGAERLGPLTEEQFQQAVGTGAVNSATLVWCDGMAQWLPYGQVAGGGVAMAEGGVCSQCRRSFPTDELVTYEGHVVCAECKPTFLQRIREGVISPVVMQYAGFWIRFVAVIIDLVLLELVQMVLHFAFTGEIFASPYRQPKLGVGVILASLLWYAIAFSYVTMMVGRYGATLGKMALGLRIVRADGGRVGYGRAFCRCLAWILSYIILLIGLIMAGFTSQKQALHDYMCDTRVIKK
jgi:uncharacterized RDD family membrane protein YckC